ncbi:MAG: hypothetical protein KDI71_24425 [Xanthomonadales bacterium]|nr:hypothetical protein [Xanthomonadales bacterium]
MTRQTLPAQKPIREYLPQDPIVYAGYGRRPDGSLALIREDNGPTDFVGAEHADAAERELLAGWGDTEVVTVPLYRS